MDQTRDIVQEVAMSQRTNLGKPRRARGWHACNGFRQPRLKAMNGLRPYLCSLASPGPTIERFIAGAHSSLAMRTSDPYGQQACKVN